MSNTVVDLKVALDIGLSEEEYQYIIKNIQRAITLTEINIFAVMYSEHCSYKSSKKWLKTLPTKAPWVIQGPGENAGIIEISKNKAIAFKIESHNHPSFISPYHGAATAVGGIMRDIFTMGARPIALLDVLKFGNLTNHKTKYLLTNVVAGIGDYGNCFGVPNLGGETHFHHSYNNNIIVNAMCVGIVDKDKIFYSSACGVNNLIVYLGSKTGRDGVHGATMASQEFSDQDSDQISSIQIGDPFAGKILLEACLEIMQQDCIVAIQDMGAAGLTSSSVEMAHKGNVGIELDLDMVPLRDDNMLPHEIMLSESQERMLMVVEPNKINQITKILNKWDIEFATIGKVVKKQNITIKWHNEIVADLPLDIIMDNIPDYNRSWKIHKLTNKIHNTKTNNDLSWSNVLIQLFKCSDIFSKQWIWQQYDKNILNNTIQYSGGDSGVIRIEDNIGIAMTTDSNARYVFANPILGGKQTVVESWRNLISVGAKPLAITDNMNFGNPQKEEIMGQFVGFCQGMAEACTLLEYPVVSGNVSFCNETDGKAILPTPVIGGIGIIDNINKVASIHFKHKNETVIIIGDDLKSNTGWLGQSIYLKEIINTEDGAPPPVDLLQEQKNGLFIQYIINEHNINTVHDISDGGLLVAITEMTMKLSIGVKLNISNKHDVLFGEDQGRYIISVPEEKINTVVKLANKQAIKHKIIGTTQGSEIIINDEKIAINNIKHIYNSVLPDYINTNNTK